MSLQEKMDSAVDNYLALSDILRPDLEAMLAQDDETSHWRRNFIRASAALLEGYIFCWREIASVGHEGSDPKLSGKENEALDSEANMPADKRFKLTLRAAFKRLDLEPIPDFGGSEWERSRIVFSKRHMLMHPKRPSELEISNEQWIELREGIIWLFEQTFSFMSLLEAKYAG